MKVAKAAFGTYIGFQGTYHLAKQIFSEFDDTSLLGFVRAKITTVDNSSIIQVQPPLELLKNIEFLTDLHMKNVYLCIHLILENLGMVQKRPKTGNMDRPRICQLSDLFFA